MVIIWSILIIFWVIIFPLVSCWVLDYFNGYFKGIKILYFIFLYSLLSWVVSNGLVLLKYAINPASFNGPEGIFALFFGYLYLWFTSIPVFLIYLTIKAIKSLKK